MLATHPDTQASLHAEVRQLPSDTCNGSAEAVQSAPLLNAVILETLRLHPPTLWSNRGLTTPLTLSSPNGCMLTLPAGSAVFVPIWAVRAYMPPYTPSPSTRHTRRPHPPSTPREGCEDTSWRRTTRPDSRCGTSARTQVHRSPLNWTRPNEWLPSRFLPTNDGGPP
jgi:hypothetical protein